MTELDEKYDVDESFPMLMSTCVKYMRESLNARFMLNGCAITSEQWMMLMYLSKQDGMSQQHLADDCSISKVSALNLIKKLEKNNLLVRHPDPVDGRSNRVYLTSEGRKIQRLLIPLAQKNTNKIAQGIAREDIEQLKQIVKKMIGNLKS